MHTGTIHVSDLVSSAPGSPRKRCCESVISVLGWGLPIFLARLDFRPRAGALTCGCTHSDLILTNGTPGSYRNSAPKVFRRGIAVSELPQIGIYAALENVGADIRFDHP